MLSDGTVWQNRQQGKERGACTIMEWGVTFFVCPRCALDLLGWKLVALGLQCCFHYLFVVGECPVDIMKMWTGGGFGRRVASACGGVACTCR